MVLVFNESPFDYRTSNKMWTMGGDIVKEDIIYTYLGISLKNNLSIDDNVKEAASKIKDTFLSLVNSGIHARGFNPITSRRIYKTGVLPKHYTDVNCGIQIDLLEKSQKLCLKFMQFLPRRTSTYLAFSLLNIKSI